MFENVFVMVIFLVVMNIIWPKKKTDPKALPWLFRPLWLPDDKSDKSTP